MTSSEAGGCPAESTWLSSCEELSVPATAATGAWRQLATASSGDDIWHSLRNCVAYQTGVWQELLSKGMQDVTQPAAFKLALVLRHTPQDVAVKMLNDVLKKHSHCRDLTSYILALLTEDETPCPPSSPPSSPSPPGPAPRRDLQLFNDCELAVLAGASETYDRHAALVRNEYRDMSERTYAELRIKILNQLIRIPRLYHTMEFETLEQAAKDNINREIQTLNQQLLKHGGNIVIKHLKN